MQSPLDTARAQLRVLTPPAPSQHKAAMLLQYCIIDGFLGEETARDILEFALANETGFEPSKLAYDSELGVVDTEKRNSFTFAGEWDAQAKAFQDRLDQHMEQILAETGTRPFTETERDIGLVAHRDGGLFHRHIDALAAENRGLVQSDRMISLVYYMHREPKRFSGGELVLHPLVGEDAAYIEPKHDRLIAFTSIAPHEVKRLEVPGNAFEDARFSIVCWLARARAAKKELA